MAKTQLTPKSVRQATPEEIDDIQSGKSRTPLWEFPDELFDGEWYRLTAPASDEVTSMTNAYRHAAESRGFRASASRRDGFVYVRMTDVPHIPPPSQRKKEDR